MKKTLKGTLALSFGIVMILATMLLATAIGAPKAKVKTITYNTVTISWSKVKDADQYEVQRSTDGKKWTTLSSSVKSTSYKATKLTTGKTYKFRVRAVEKRLFKNNYSSWKTVSAKPVPGKTSGLKAASKTNNSVKLSWTKVSGASGYVVQKYSSGKWSTYKTTTKTAMTVSKLSLGKTYNFRVRAYRTVSGKKVYGAYSSTLKTGPVLTAPSTFNLTAVNSTSLTLSWSAVTGAKGYEVYNATTKKWTNTKTKRTLTVKSLKAGTKYGFIVRAYSGSYDGEKTATRYFTTTPSAPTGIKVSSSATSVTFSWNKVSGATKYQPAIYNHTAKKWTNLADTDKTTVTVSKLSSATKFSVKVRAYAKNTNVKDISANTYSAWSAEAVAFTTPAAPKTINLTGATDSSLTISWTASTGASGYEYYNPVTEKWVSSGTSRTATVSGLEAGTKYSFKVRAVLGDKKSADSSAFSFITAPAAPSGLSNILADANGVVYFNSTADSVTLTWSATAGAAGYQVQYSTDSETWTSLNNTTSTTATVTGLTADTVYFVRVRAYVNNSNVSGISSKIYGNYATTQAKTLNNAAIVASASSPDSRTIKISWDAQNDVQGYIVEKFDIAARDWVPYVTNSSSQWVALDSLSEQDVILVTDQFILDKGNYSRTDIYRVRVVDKNGFVGAPSAVVTGTTADLIFSAGTSTATFEWPATNGATAYKIYNRYPFTLEIDQIPVSQLTYNSAKNTYKVTLNFAPESIQSIIIYPTGQPAGTQTTSVMATFTTGALPTDTSDAAKNSQLLYLARAINNTKEYLKPITVKNDSVISSTIEELHLKFGLINWDYDTPDEVSKFFSSLGEDEQMNVNTVENYSEEYTFDNGTSHSTEGRTMRLRNFIEPSTTTQLYAKLYNGLTSTTAWKNGFSSVSTTKNSDGSYTITANLKQESKTSPYHNGFIASISAADIGGAEGFEMTDVRVGPSTLEATITPDGILKSYEVKSSFSSTVEARVQGDSGDFLGKLLEMSMTMGGSTNYKYTITK